MNDYEATLRRAFVATSMAHDVTLSVMALLGTWIAFGGNGLAADVALVSFLAALFGLISIYAANKSYLTRLARGAADDDARLNVLDWSVRVLVLVGYAVLVMARRWS